MATLKDFEQWLQELSRFGEWDFKSRKSKPPVPHVEYDEPDTSKEGEIAQRVRIYTDTNKYSIVAIQCEGKDYMGCIANSRKPRAGEDWNRGRDLSDGPFSYKTWHEILADIVSYEMVKIHRQPSETSP